MPPRFLTISKYEVKQYSGRYFEQLFVFAGIILIFLILSPSDAGAGTLDTPSSYSMYRIGYNRGSAFEAHNHYSLNMLPYDSRAEALEDLEAGAIDVYAFEECGGASFETAGTVKSAAALKRVQQVMVGVKRDRIYALADANESLDGILLPIKVRTEEIEVDYGGAIDPSVLLHRVRFINRSRDNGNVSDVNILDIDEVMGQNLSGIRSGRRYSSAENDTDEVGFTLPEEWEIPFVFESLYHNMSVVSVSILLALLLTLSFAREKVNDTMDVLLQTPAAKWEILAGKSIPYLSVMVAVNLAYGFVTVGPVEGLKIGYIFTVLSVTLVSFALFAVLASRSYRELTFTSTISLLSFLMFIVLPNIFSGLNVLAFISPLDTITSIENNAPVGLGDVFLSLLPYKFLSMFFLAASLMCFNADTFHNTPGVLGLVKLFYTNLSRRLGGGVKYMVAGVALLVPFIYVVQNITAYLIIPLGLAAPYASLLVLALAEELAKILPYHFNRRINPLLYGVVAGASFFVTEKVFNIYLISKVYSYLPPPYTMFVFKGLAYTLFLHVTVTAAYAFLLSKTSGRRSLFYGLAAATVIHAAYNLFMLRGGVLR